MPLSPQDQFAIHRLLADYCHTFSACDADGWVALFTEDAVWERAAPAQGDKYNEIVRHEGHASLRELATSSFATQGVVQYVCANPVISGGGDQATGHSTAFIVGVVDGAASIVVIGNFDDDYRRTPDGWKFSRRVVRLLS